MNMHTSDDLKPAQAAQSEYLKCEGLCRLVLWLSLEERTGFGRTAPTKTGHFEALCKAISIELHCLQSRWRECSNESVGRLVEIMVDRGWLEWVEAKPGLILRGTRLGQSAWKSDPSPPTIRSTSKAIPIILRILSRAKHEPTVHGDPRLLGHFVKEKVLPEWASHFGTDPHVVYEATQTIVGRGWATSDTGSYMDRMTGYMVSRPRYRITEDGEDALNQMEKGTPSAARLSTPTEILDSLRAFVADHPPPTRTAFIMMDFATSRAHQEIEAAIKSALDDHGITGLRADDKEYHENLYENVATYMHGCTFGVAVFERIETQEQNPSVALEVGYMLALSRSVCLLKDKTLTAIPTDVVGKLYRQFDPQDPEGSIPQQLARWVDEKGFGR